MSLNMKENICIYNLQLHEEHHFVVESADDVKEALKVASRDNEDSCELYYNGGCLMGEARSYFSEVLDIAGNNELALSEAGKIFNAVENREDIQAIVDEKAYMFVFANSQEMAFREYTEQQGLLKGVPSHIVDYIDFGAWFRDSNRVDVMPTGVASDGVYEYIVLFKE